MQLIAQESSHSQEIPFHYVLVLDVRGSMRKPYGLKSDSLLERFKVCDLQFAKLFSAKFFPWDAISVDVYFINYDALNKLLSEACVIALMLNTSTCLQTRGSQPEVHVPLEVHLPT